MTGLCPRYYIACMLEEFRVNLHAVSTLFSIVLVSVKFVYSTTTCGRKERVFFDFVATRFHANFRSGGPHETAFRRPNPQLFTR